MNFTLDNHKGKLLIQCVSNVIGQLCVKINIANVQVWVLLSKAVQERLSFLAFKTEVIGECDSFAFLDQEVVLCLWVLSFCAFWNQLAKFSIFYWFLYHVQSSHEFSIDEKLGIGWPVLVCSEPVSHVFVVNNIVEGKLNTVVLENL